MANPSLVDEPLAKHRQKTRDKVIAACSAIQSLGPVKRALLEAGVDAEKIPGIMQIFNAKRDPYALVLHGFLSFTVADKFARTPLRQDHHVFDPDNPRRAVAQALNDARRHGHCGAACEALESIARKQYAFPDEVIHHAVGELIGSGKFATLEENAAIDFIWHKKLLNIERKIATAVLSLRGSGRLALTSGQSSAPPVKKLRKAISDVAKSIEFNPSAEQTTGIVNALIEPISILTGPPGSGKTSALCVLAGIVPNDDIIGCSPTARGAVRLEELTGIESMTVHRLLGIRWGEEYDYSNLIGRRFLVVDETSMTSIWLLEKLLSAACKANVEHVILVGDADQLVAGGPGRAVPRLDRERRRAGYMGYGDLSVRQGRRHLPWRRLPRFRAQPGVTQD